MTHMFKSVFLQSSALISSLSLLFSCSSGDATVWTTTFDKSKEFEKTIVHPGGKAGDSSIPSISLTDKTFQSVDGFGLAITQASCHVLLQMKPEDRHSLLTEMFSPVDGAGSSLVRVCIGGSDFSMDEYTWWDTPGKENLKVHESEYKYLFPVLDEIYAINPDLQIIGSPWSCPRWMKVDPDDPSKPFDSWTSGRLNPECYGDYADLFVKWVKEMEARGYHVMAVTPQNEPLHKGNSMSLYMPWQDERDFVKVLGPRFKEAGLSTRILVFDHNYDYDGHEDQAQYPLRIYANPEASAYVSGSAWHNYRGNVSELDDIHAAAPDKDIYFTEASIGTWNYRGENAFGRRFSAEMRDIFLGTLSRYCKGVVLWNLILDNEGKPNRGEAGGCATCLGGASIDSSSWTLESVVRNSHWYEVLHCSVAIKPGAVRIGTEGFEEEGITYLAFRNPDGSIAVVCLNSTRSDRTVAIRLGRRPVNVSFPARSVVSVVI